MHVNNGFLRFAATKVLLKEKLCTLYNSTSYEIF